MLRGRLILVLAGVGLASAACGGSSSSKAPLTLEQRLPTQAEVSGWSSRPPRGVPANAPWSQGGAKARWTTATAFWKDNRDQLIRASLADAKGVFADAGFVAAVGHRYVGKPKAGERPGLAVVALQFGSGDGAKNVSTWRNEDKLKPCPRKCDVSISGFEVNGVPQSWGVRRSVTQRSINLTGDKSQRPFDSYEVGFADDGFVYIVVADGPPGSVSESNVVAVAKALSARVHGAPAPS